MVAAAAAAAAAVVAAAAAAAVAAAAAAVAIQPASERERGNSGGDLTQGMGSVKWPSTPIS